MWTQPKTNWSGSSVNGVYTGDHFTCVDFNRIKNNLEFLRDIAIIYYPSFPIISLGADRTYADFVYADEINAMESNLNTINEHTVNRDYGKTPVFYPNDDMIDFAELNRLESAILDIYYALVNQNDSEHKRMFTWNFGKGLGL